jgi:hypothetical protein
LESSDIRLRYTNERGGHFYVRKRRLIMFLRKNFDKKTGRTYLQIVHGYRTPEGKVRTKVHEGVGYLDVLEKEMADPIAFYEAKAKAMGEEAAAGNIVKFAIKADAEISRNGTNLKNYGYIALSKIYHELELDRFFNNKRRHERFKFNSESIMRLLSFSRVLYPHSKRQTFEIKDRYFDSFEFSLYDVYDSLSHFSRCAEAAQRHIHEKITEQYGRDASLIYYDVTNYYFETDKQDSTRKKGCAKDHRPDPIIQMGLAIDGNGIPMAYRTYPGNTNDSETYIPALKEIKKEYNIGRAVVVADKGLNCGDNIVFNSALGDGYVFSQSIRGGSDEFKAYVLDGDGYSTPTADGFKSKSRVLPVTVKITVGVTKSGNKSKKSVTLEAQKQVVFYSPKYAARAKKERAEAVEKAAFLIKEPSKYNRAIHYGAAAYVENLELDKDGEIKATDKRLMLNYAKIAEEEKFDGFYAIITSETDESDKHIIDMYHGLWKIEETFKVTKSVLRTRPVFVYLNEHIGGHFLVCFIALTMLRLLELRLGGGFPAHQIVEAMRSVTCSHIDGNYYLFHYADAVTDAINSAFGTDIGKRIMSLGDIRKSIGQTKKRKTD